MRSGLGAVFKRGIFASEDLPAVTVPHAVVNPTLTTLSCPSLRLTSCPALCSSRVPIDVALASPRWELCAQTTIFAGAERERWEERERRVVCIWVSRRFQDDTSSRNIWR